MSSRAADLVGGSRARWPLCGDQIYVDLDLSVSNLPDGARLRLGGAVIEVSKAPHTGCSKFAARFGEDSFAWVNSPAGRAARLRGLNASVVTSGVVRVGDRVVVIRAAP
jgi:MOSC domain-containing protein YiiM